MPGELARRRAERVAGGGRVLGTPDEQRGALGRGIGFLLSGEEFLGATLEPAVKRLTGKDIDISDLPGPLRLLADLTLSPLGLLLTAAAPITGGASLGIRGAGIAAKTARFGARLIPEAGVAAAATGVGRLVDELVPDDAPGAVQLVAPILGAFGGGIGAGLGIRGLLRTAPRAAVTASARRSGRKFIVDQTSIDDAVLEIRGGLPKGPAGRALARLGKPIDPSKTFVADSDITDLARRRLLAGNEDAADVMTINAFVKKISDVFDIDANNVVRNVPRAVGATVGDVLSNPNAIKQLDLNAEQASVFTRVHEYIAELRSTLADDGLELFPKFDADGSLYFPRQALAKDGKLFAARSDPASKRFYDNEGLAQSKGTDYANPDIAMRELTKVVLDLKVEKQFDEAIKNLVVSGAAAAFAKKEGRIAFGQWSRAQGVTQKAKRAAKTARERGFPLDTITKQKAFVAAQAVEETKRAEWLKTQNRIWKTLPGHLWGRGSEDITVSQWKGGFLPAEDVANLAKWENEALQGLPEAITKVQQVGDLMRFTAATADFAMPFVQGLPLLANNPVAWGKMAARHYAAFFDPNIQRRYIERNFDDIIDMVQESRVPIGNVELFESLKQGGLAERILSVPGMKQTAKPLFTRFQRSYDTGLLIARTELFKAMRPRWQGTVGELGASVRNMSGGLETRSLGVGPGQRGLESMALFSPRLLRSTLALVTDAARPWTPRGAEAAHTLLRMSAAAAGLMAVTNVAVGVMAGDTEEEIEKRLEGVLNPTNGRQFLGVQVGDQWYGLGGQVRSIAQLIARAATTPSELTRDDALDNPLIRFAQGKLSPVASVVLGSFELITEEKHNIMPFDTIDSFPDVLGLAATGMMPFFLQTAKEEGWDLTNPSPFVELFGPRSSPPTPTDVLNREAQVRFGLDYTDLTGIEQEEIAKEFPKAIEARKAFGGKAEREHRENVDINDARAFSTLEAAAQAQQGGQATRKELRETINDTLHDRFVANKSSREALGIEFGAADTPKRAVLDAYFQTFEDAALTAGGTQINWDRWEELQAELDTRITAGEFGNPASARRQVEDRRRFVLPDELKWFDANKKLIEDTGYWEVKDEVFALIEPALKRLGLILRSARELELQMAKAAETAPNREFTILRSLWNRLNSVASKRRQLMRRRNPALDRALRENGHIEVPLRG